MNWMNAGERVVVEPGRCLETVLYRGFADQLISEDGLAVVAYLHGDRLPDCVVAHAIPEKLHAVAGEEAGVRVKGLVSVFEAGWCGDFHSGLCGSRCQRVVPLDGAAWISRWIACLVAASMRIRKSLLILVNG